MIHLDPGEWQDTETGTENGEPVKPEVTTECMSAKDAQDPVKAIAALKSGVGQEKCKTLQVKENGNTVTIDMECGDPKIMSVAISMNVTFLNPRHYAGTAKSTIILAGKTITADKQIDSKWIGACKKR